MPPAPRLLLHAAGLAVGAVSGVLGSFVHGLVLVGVPVGLLCALALTVVAIAAAGLSVAARSGALAAAVGWVAPVLLLSAPRPEGDLVVPGSWLGYAWLLGGMLLAAVAVSWPYAGASRPSSADDLVGR